MSDEKIRDIKNGDCYKRNKYFQENPEAYGAILYSDAIELKNPLGAARGSYKVVQVYYTLCEIEKGQRSKIDRVQLLMVYKEKLLKKYSMKTIMKVLVEDLLKLEHGVEIKYPMTRKVKCGVSCYSADNLEASVVGGFSGCFSSRDICRMCHIQHEDLETQIHDVHGTLYNLWSVEEYDEIVRKARLDALDVGVDDEVDEGGDGDEMNQESLFREYNDEDDESESGGEGLSEGDGDEAAFQRRGLNSECPLNILQSFHAVNGFPFDIMHDMLEGKFT